MYIHYILALALVAQGCHAWESKIIHGEPAIPSQYPHQVALYWNVSSIIGSPFICGGVIIDPEWILTAGQCVVDVGVLNVKAGKYDISVDEASVQNRYVVKSIRHKDYRRPIPSKHPAKNDIALLKLNEPLTFDENVQAINLPEAHAVHTGSANVSGWGSVSSNIFPHYPDKLQSVQLTIIDRKPCSLAINSSWLRKFWGLVLIRESQICTGAIGSTAGACLGDTGGGLVQYNSSTNATELVGIFSWTRFPCGKPGFPNVYTRVSEYIDWIATNQGKNETVF